MQVDGEFSCVALRLNVYLHHLSNVGYLIKVIIKVHAYSCSTFVRTTRFSCEDMGKWTYMLSPILMKLRNFIDHVQKYARIAPNLITIVLMVVIQKLKNSKYSNLFIVFLFRLTESRT
jgi:hypothetical protein